ncbi:otoancorin-like [Ambystoma mexicanum]|uniref:otoancorin-like n=1 Tax=Ambystoma mexicanum TaxID=8296 RepID=UPI0037E83B77
MSREVTIILALLLMIPTKSTKGQRWERDLPPLIKHGLEELIAGKYLNALLDFLLFESANSWTSDLFRRIMAYLSSQETMITVSGLQASLERHLEGLLLQPRRLLSELRQINSQQFHLAMRYLFSGRRVQFLDLD